MNNIIMRYTAFSQKAEVSINEEPLSPYSELFSLLIRPFHEIVEDILPIFDKEIFDNYEIDFYGVEFQYELLNSCVEKSEYCKKITYHEMNRTFAIQDCLERLQELCKKYSVAAAEPEKVRVFYGETVGQHFGHPASVLAVTDPMAEIGIFNSISEIPAEFNGIRVVAEDETGISKLGNKPLYLVQKDKIQTFWKYYEVFHDIIPTISESLAALKYAKLSEAEQIEIEAIQSDKPAYYLSELPAAIDLGEECQIAFKSFPEDAFEAVSDNEEAFCVQNGKLLGKQAGKYSLKIRNKEGQNVAVKELSIIEHRYVEEIRLLSHFEYLRKNDRNQTDVIMIPNDAEDVNELQWEVSDPRVIQVEKNGSIVALESGRATIRVSGRKASVTLDVEVKPEVQELRLSQSAVRLKLGRMVILDCEIVPENAHVGKLVWELDNRSIATINPSKSGRRCQVIASTRYEGKGNVRCYEEESKRRAVCNLEVITKVKQNSIGTLALLFWLFGFLVWFLLPISTGFSIWGMVKDKEPEHKNRYVVCLIGSLTTLILRMLIEMAIRYS